MKKKRNYSQAESERPAQDRASRKTIEGLVQLTIDLEMLCTVLRGYLRANQDPLLLSALIIDPITRLEELTDELSRSLRTL